MCREKNSVEFITEFTLRLGVRFEFIYQINNLSIIFIIMAQ